MDQVSYSKGIRILGAGGEKLANAQPLEHSASCDDGRYTHRKQTN